MTVSHALLRAVPRRRGQPWLEYLVLCGLAVAGFLLLGPASEWTAPHILLFESVAAACAVTILVSIRRHRPARPLGWYLAAVAVGITFLADLTWFVVVDLRDAAMTASLVGYPVGGVALVLLIRQRNPGPDRAGFLDTLVIATGLGLLLWAYLLVPYFRDQTMPVAAKLAGLASPVFDAALLVLAARLAASGGRAFALRLVIAGLIVLLATDTLNTIEVLDGAGDGPALLDTGWMAFYALLGAAALHPSMRVINHRVIPPPARLTQLRISVLVGVAVATPTLLALGSVTGEPVHPGVLVGGSALLCALVVTRMTTLVGDERAWADQQEQVLQQIVEATTQERGRIAADLHDGPIQRLTGVALATEVARRQADRGEVTATRRFLGDAAEQIGKEIRTLRELMVDLHPPALDQDGLAAAIRQAAATFTRATGTDCAVTVEPALRLDTSREMVAYRVVQEALNNATKHADASRVEVSLRVDGETARLEIRDDGVGFETDRVSAEHLLDRRHFGLVGMRQRVAVAGGTFRIRSMPGHGTRITVHLPLPAAGRGAPAGATGAAGDAGEVGDAGGAEATGAALPPPA